MKHLAILCIVIIGSISCNTEPITHEFTRNEKKVIDSLYRAEVKKLKPKLDSICELEQEKQYQAIKDSMIELRLEEIENLLSKE